MKALVAHHKHRRWINLCYCCRNIFSGNQSLPGFLKHSPAAALSCKAPWEQCWWFGCSQGGFLCDFHEFCHQVWWVCVLCALFPPGSAAQAHSLCLAQSKVLIQHQRLLQNNESLWTAKCYGALDVELIGKIKGRPRGETCDLFPKQKKAWRWTLSGLSHSHSLGSIFWNCQICDFTLQQQRNSAFGTEMRQSNKITIGKALYLLLCQKLVVNGSSWEVPEPSLHFQLHFNPLDSSSPGLSQRLSSTMGIPLLL